MKLIWYDNFSNNRFLEIQDCYFHEQPISGGFTICFYSFRRKKQIQVRRLVEYAKVTFEKNISYRKGKET